MNKFKVLLISAVTLLPAVAFAENDLTPKTVNQIFGGFARGNLSGLIPVLVLVAVVTFLSGLVGFVSAGDNEEKRQAGRQIMIFGIVVLFIMVSFWGFVGILSNSFFGKKYGLPNYLPVKLK